MNRRCFLKTLPVIPLLLKPEEKFDPKPEMFQRRPKGCLKEIDRDLIAVYDINIDFDSFAYASLYPEDRERIL